MNAPSPSPAKNKRRKAYFKGHYAETIAALLLVMKGYRIIARRFKTRHGEIDLIARKGNTIIFVEVKARADKEAALYSIHPKQRQRISDAAQVFLHKRHMGGEYLTRFDAIAIAPFCWPLHIKNAWR